MKTLLKVAVLSAAIYSSSTMAMTKKECLDGGGSWEGTILTGTCSQKITAMARPTADIKVQITAEQCKKQGGTVSNGNCITVTHYKTKTAPAAPQ